MGPEHIDTFAFWLYLFQECGWEFLSSDPGTRHTRYHAQAIAWFLCRNHLDVLLYLL